MPLRTIHLTPRQLDYLRELVDAEGALEIESRHLEGDDTPESVSLEFADMRAASVLNGAATATRSRLRSLSTMRYCVTSIRPQQ